MRRFFWLALIAETRLLRKSPRKRRRLLGPGQRAGRPAGVGRASPGSPGPPPRRTHTHLRRSGRVSSHRRYRITPGLARRRRRPPAPVQGCPRLRLTTPCCNGAREDTARKGFDENGKLMQLQRMVAATTERGPPRKRRRPRGPGVPGHDDGTQRTTGNSNWLTPFSLGRYLGGPPRKRRKPLEPRAWLPGPRGGCPGGAGRGAAASSINASMI